MLVLILLVLGQVDDCVKGFKVGGDDYFFKFYVFIEFQVWVEVLVWWLKMVSQVEIIYMVGDLILDCMVYFCWCGEIEIFLQLCEFCLLEYLMQYVGQVVIRMMLLENVWEYYFDLQINVIDVYILWLCGKIDKGFEILFLYMIWGVGYMICLVVGQVGL